MEPWPRGIGRGDWQQEPRAAGEVGGTPADRLSEQRPERRQHSCEQREGKEVKVDGQEQSASQGQSSLEVKRWKQVGDCKAAVDSLAAPAGEAPARTYKHTHGFVPDIPPKLASPAGHALPGEGASLTFTPDIH